MQVVGEYRRPLVLFAKKWRNADLCGEKTLTGFERKTRDNMRNGIFEGKMKDISLFGHFEG